MPKTFHSTFSETPILGGYQGPIILFSEFYSKGGRGRNVLSKNVPL